MEDIQTWRNKATTICWVEVCQLWGSVGAMVMDSAETAKLQSWCFVLF
jgi:hypothetical protein